MTWSTPKPIAVIRGDDGNDARGGEAVQGVLREAVARLAPTVRVAGLVEMPGRGRNSSRKLRNIGDGKLFSLFQDLGAGSSGCALDNASLVEAGEAARRDIAAGCDLVVLSKFAKAEAEKGSGLLPAFVAAMEAGAPILTSVAPKFEPAWARFAEPLFDIVGADIDAVLLWWRTLQR